MKNIQISEELFYDLARFHLLGQRNEELERRIGAGLEQKLQKMADRERYSRTLAEAKEKKVPSPE